MPLSECDEKLRQGNFAALENGVSEGQYCAYDPQGKNDSCTGDSGGYNFIL